MAIADSAVSYRAWSAPSPKAVFLLVHGLGGNENWWESLGNFFIQRGYSSYAADLRPSRTFGDFKKNVIDLQKIIKTQNPDKKIFAVGESMGSLIILSAALSVRNIFDGLACMSPAFKSRTKLNFMDYFKIFFPLLYNPQKMYKLPLTTEMCTRDTDYIKIVEADYNKDVLSTSEVLFDIFLTQVRMGLMRIKLEIPVLFLLAGADKVTDNNVSRKIFNNLKCPDKILIEYPGMYHSLSIDLGKESVFSDMADWAEKRS